MSKKIFMKVIGFLREISSTLITSNSNSCYMKEDGLKFYSLTQTRTLEEYTLSVPYDLTTKTLVNSRSLGAINTTTDFIFKDDGLIVFVLDSLSGVSRILTYSLSIAFDTSSSLNLIRSWTITGATFDRFAFCFNSDGTKFYTSNSSNNINEYSLSVGYDFSSTITHNGIVFYTSLVSSIDGLSFGNYGNNLYVSGRYDNICLYKLNTPYSFVSPLLLKRASLTAYGLRACVTNRYSIATRNTIAKTYLSSYY